MQFICDEGFNLRGSKIRQCLSTGNWSGSESLCEGKKKYVENRLQATALENSFETGQVIIAIIVTFLAVNCGGLSSPLNGSISGNLTVYPNIVSFSCDPGFILRGSSIRKCRSNGTWDGFKTACAGKMRKTSSGKIL